MSTVPDPGFPDQARKRTVLRVVGGLCMAVALVLIGIALADFFSVFASDDFDRTPTKFWMFFLAMPFFAVGAGGLSYGFLGAAARYGAGETVPVVKDSAAYLTDGEGVLGIGRTVDDGPAEAGGPFCRACGARNDVDARFCDSCGQPLG